MDLIQPHPCLGKFSVAGTQPYPFLPCYLWLPSHCNSGIALCMQQDHLAHKLRTFSVWSFTKVCHHLSWMNAWRKLSVQEVVTVIVTVPVKVDTQVLEHSLAPSTEGLVQFRLQVVYPSVLILKPHTKETHTVGHVLGLCYRPVSWGQ